MVAMTVTALQTRLFLRENRVALATVGRTHPMKTTRVGRPRALGHSCLVSTCKHVALAAGLIVTRPFIMEWSGARLYHTTIYCGRPVHVGYSSVTTDLSL